jgi:biopolymer transport protein TolQ
MFHFLITKGQNQGINIWNVVLHGGLIAKITLILLGIFSIISWMIIFQKLFMLVTSRIVTKKFRKTFRKTNDWMELKSKSTDFAASPLTRLFIAGYSEIAYQLRPNSNTKLQVKNIETIERCLQRAIMAEVNRMENYLGILATTAAISPFIGLFGTVWGIIEAFHGIGASGNASLITVAPGISEALVATAMGLIVAIPALMAYNFFQGQLKYWQTELNDFALEFISLSERHFT